MPPLTLTVASWRSTGNAASPGANVLRENLTDPLYISRRVDGKIRYDYVPEDKVDLAKVLVGRHTRLYKARAQIQKINREVNEVLDRIVELNRVEFPKKAEKGEKGIHQGPTGS